MQKYQFDNFYQIIEENNKKAPNHTIIFEHELKFTNKELKKHIDVIASFLHKNNIKQKDKVALIMTNCWQFVVSLFAISKIGAIAVPINNFLKEDELAYILNDSQTKLLFSSNKFAHETKNLLIKTDIEKIIWVDGFPVENERNFDFAKIISNNISSTPAYNATEDEDALIVYTSGTTGKPKGAILSFKNVLSNCFGSKTLMKANNGEVKMICYLPMFHAFTLTVTIILPIFTNSSIIIIRSVSNKKDFKYLLKQLLFKRCRFFTGVPDIYSAMARAKLPWYFHWFHNVKGFISGAAPLSDEIAKRFSKSFKRGKLLQGYGISECSPVVSCNTPEENRFGSVGKPLTGYKVKIFDEDMKELPINQIGEICVKGDCVMKGYYNRPQETMEAIIDGWFKTGDLGKIDKDGYIFIVDRKKDLIIHKGMNIYPREVEEVLYTHNSINACAVIGVKDKEETEIPVAYIELKENEKATEQELKDFLKPHLATFKIPRKIYFMEKLPKNATGKILKRELRDLVQ
ncbi:MAG TPA: long-chain-fatty-acid--CoA ligase [Burkholderiales bacterium]|nr:long-chain-fatty-acid--CoA ligase [Burkholderiales bacterium]